MAEKLNPEKQLYFVAVRINAFSYAANVSYASLNIMFFATCKFCNCLASLQRPLKFIRFVRVTIVTARGACLSELNVK